MRKNPFDFSQVKLMSEYTPRKFETIAQVAQRLAITPNTVRRYIADGKLRTYGMSSRAIRLDAAEVDEAFTRTSA
ncbi:helix-turn-helix domain-containing protein [Rhodococcus sp. 2G]|nr:helix-turn-helix domain-containing protein [Rhodococcus sp. 2G]